MFGQSVTLPIEKGEQEWIEKSLLWLLEEFGKDYFLSKTTIIPHWSSFPIDYKGTDECVRRLVDCVCGFMNVNPSLIDMEICGSENYADTEDLAAGESRFEGAAGMFVHEEGAQRMLIQIDEGCLNDCLKLVATIAHELGHARLLGEGRLSPDDPAHELMTDLITVFLGMGIFTANSSFQFNQWTDGSMQGWNVSRAGYMSEAMFGYALAACCWMRSEAKPRWSDLLAMNVGHYFQNSLKYLNKGGHTTLPKLR